MNGADWTVPADHPAFAGHFPGRPIVPGVVLLDRAVLLAAAALGRPPAGLRIAAAKFFSPVGPGETVRFTWRPKSAASLDLSIEAAGRAVATATLQFPRDVP